MPKQATRYSIPKFLWRALYRTLITRYGTLEDAPSAERALLDLHARLLQQEREIEKLQADVAESKGCPK